jgi:CsoR family transcriptional regulator, copper-sensing transcriptional repressor
MVRVADGTLGIPPQSCSKRAPSIRVLAGRSVFGRMVRLFIVGSLAAAGGSGHGVFSPKTFACKYTPTPYVVTMERDCRQRKPLTGRINRIAGQVQGIGRMIEENRDCPEILHTISAVHAALRGLEASLLEDHVRHCVAEAAADPKQLDRRLEELVTLYKRRLA